MTPQAALREYYGAVSGQKGREFTKKLAEMSRKEQIEQAESIIGELENAELITDNQNVTFRSDRDVVSANYAQKYYEKHLKRKE